MESARSAGWSARSAEHWPAGPSLLIQRAEVVFDQVAQAERDAAGVVAQGRLVRERRLHRFRGGLGAAGARITEVRVDAALVGGKRSGAGHLLRSGNRVETAARGARP